ncbi:sugar phosphate isomerase/epimerase [Paenibacillus sp. MWE-103]|uniref:Sugar phosphate isomerase/epimerase n=1 Tax=Paenibacillus artemisiicola TaxID=1172618 RepID=A0ABS3WDQ8_9BACL|nr:sugar phosphate isomerase/epimerase family protein [Paenibacillus artemisiicola]MBO7746398.1 sugar phosphate isomerase/epimerase [Paenibacillus artemisiicola]
MAAVILTCFADEISHDLEEQLDVLAQEGLSHIELRNVWGKNVLDLTAEELAEVRRIAEARGFGVSSIASPIGKYAASDDFAPQLDALDRAIAAAKALGTRYIRLFSYYPPEGARPEDCRDEALSRMKRLADAAAPHGVTLVLENDSGLYGSTDDRCLDILRHCDSEALRLAFDPGNFVMEGVRPMTEAYPKLAPYVAYVHVKDASAEPKMFVPAGAGDGQLPELLEALRARSFDGFLSVEPHLHRYLPFASDPKRVVTAVRALKSLLAQAGMKWA